MRELAGEPNAEAGDWWKRAQGGEHRTRRAATLVRPAVVLSFHLPSLGFVIGRDLRSASVGLAAAGNGSPVVLLTVPNRFDLVVSKGASAPSRLYAEALLSEVLLNEHKNPRHAISRSIAT